MSESKLTADQQAMVDGALALEASLEGRTVGVVDLLMPARLAGPLARLVMEVEEQNARLRSDNADLLATSDACQHLLTRAVRAEAEVERLRGDVQRLTVQAASERARNLRLEESDDHASILSDLGDLLDQRDTWQEGEGTVDQVRRICLQRDALRSQIERLTAERTALLAPVEGVDLEEVLAATSWCSACDEPVPAEVAATHDACMDCGGDLQPPQALKIGHLAREVARLRADLEEARLTLAAETDLLRRLFATLHIGRRSEVLWSVVAAVFGLGSTRAQELCGRLGYDPHQRIGTRRRAAMIAADAATEAR